LSSYMEIGKLYQDKQYCRMVFPTVDLASLATALAYPPAPLYFTEYYLRTNSACNAGTIQLHSPVTCLGQKDLFVLLEFYERQIAKILTANGEVGFIWLAEGFITTEDGIEEVDGMEHLGKWGYRVFQNSNNEFGIVECYYDKDLKPRARSESFMKPYGESIDELKKDLERMAAALNKPVLSEKDFL